MNQKIRLLWLVMILLGFTRPNQALSNISLQSPLYCPNFASLDQTMDDQSFEEFVRETAMGWGIYGYLLPKDETLIGSGTYKIAANKPLTLTHQVYYAGGVGNGDKLAMTYIALLDEQQIPIASEKSSYAIELAQDESASFDFQLPPMAAGTHNFVLIGVLHTNQTPDIGRDTFALVQRLTFVIEQDFPDLDLQPYPLLNRDGAISRNDTHPLLLLTLDDTFRVWSYPEPALVVTPGQAPAFKIKAGYSAYEGLSALLDPNFTRFALLLFKDYEQIPISAEDEVIYAQVDSDTAYSQLDITLEDNYPPASYELLAVRIENPTVPLCYLVDVEPGDNFGDGVRIQRVTLVVGDK